MKVEWDEAKEAENRRKHGLSLADTVLLDWVGAKVVADDRADYGEIRQVAYAYLDGRMHTCVFTLRQGARRIISLRKPNSRGVRDHGTATETPLD